VVEVAQEVRGDVPAVGGQGRPEGARQELLVDDRVQPADLGPHPLVRGPSPAQAGVEGRLRAGLMQLFAVAEAYPDLKANESFQHLQSRITGLENDIADRRELYNEAVNLNNIRIQTFPDLIVARMFEFKQSALLEFTEEQKRDVDLGQLFG
jgi:LemA protein